MTDFDSYDQLPAVGQSCKYFKSDRGGSIRYIGKQEGVSCRSCTNWNGMSCVKNAFDSVINILDR